MVGAMINGPAEWSEAMLATGFKANLLQNGYNAKLQASAMSLGPTVMITRYADIDATPGLGRGVLDQPIDTLVLHANTSNTKNVTSRYRLVAWSQGSTVKSLLAVASMTQVEIWEVTTARGMSATLRGSIDVDRSQGLAWNPRNEILLSYSKTDIALIDTSQPVLSTRLIYTDSNTRHAWSACSWSPCGLQVSLAQSHILRCFGWANVDSLLAESPRHDHIDASSSLKGLNGLRLDVGNSSVGPIAAVARVSPTVCILTTDTKFVLADVSRAAPPLNTMLRNTISVETPLTSCSLLHPESPNRSNIQEQATHSSSDIVDLTSIRVSTCSNQNSLQILNCAEDINAHQNSSPSKPRSHLVIVERKAGQWSVIFILDLPHLTSPDILVVQDMRVIVGSTLSPHLLVAHLDVSNRMEWTASLSGELELPPTHVCRGIYLAERSPFADVASTEKRKRATFFHAAANDEKQSICLSKFKLPRRSPTKPVGNIQQEPPAFAVDKTSTNNDGGYRIGGGDKDMLELILAKMETMQTQLNARFDVVDQKLLQLMVRVEQLERNGTGQGNPCSS